MRRSRLLRLPVFALALAGLPALLAPAGARASLIGDQVSAQYVTGFGPQAFDQATATVGAGIEFTRTFPTAQDPDPFVELDVGATSFTFTFTNPGSTSCSPFNPTCAFNLGLTGLELSGLDDPDGAIVGVTQAASTFPAGAITGASFGPNSVTIGFAQPIIPGFGTVWSASWAILVPEPSTGLLLALGLIGLGARRRAP